MTELRWVPSVSASAMYAVKALVAGRSLADSALQCALVEPAANLMRLLQRASWPTNAFLSASIVILTAADELRGLFDEDLVGITLSRLTNGRPLEAIPWLEPGTSNIKAQYAEIHVACVEMIDVFNRALPQASHELTLRSEPLREQWEARGPGLLHWTGKLTESELIVSAADVVLLHPVLGGGGMVNGSDTVAIEAVLANPVPELPEVARLGWLLAQLGAFQRTYAAIDSPERLARVLQLAFLPAVLAAAEDVELVRASTAALPRAIDAWQVGPADPAVISDWWQCYQTEKPSWERAIQELDQRLGSVE